MVRKLGDSAKAQLAKKRKLGDGALSAKSKKKSKDKKSKKKKRQRLTKGGGTKQAAAAAPADSSSSDSDEEYERERDVARTPAGGAGNGKSKARAKAASSSSSSSSSSKAKAALYAAPLGRISPEERQQLRSAVALARIKLGSAVHKLLPASHGAPGTKATTLGKKAPTLAATITLDPRAYTLLRRAFGRAAGDESDDDDDDKEEDEEEEAAAAAEGGGIGGGKGGCEGERAALGLPRRKPVPGFGIPRRIGGGAAGAAGSGGGGSGAAALAAYRTFAAELRARARRQGKHMEPAAITAAWRAASDQDKRELRDKAEAAAAAANATATAAAAAAAGGSEDEDEDEDEGAAGGGGGGGSAAAAACPGFTERVRVNSEAALQHLLGPGAAVRSSAGFRTSAGMVKVAARVLLPAELEYTTAGSGSGSGGGSGRGLAATTPSPSSAGAGAGATAQADPAKGGGAASVAPHRLTLRFSYAFEMQTPGVRGEGGGRAPDRPGRVRCAQLRESKAKGGGLEPFRAAHALSMPAARAPAPAPAPKQQPSPPPPAKSAAAAAGAAAMARAAAAASAR